MSSQALKIQDVHRLMASVAAKAMRRVKALRLDTIQFEDVMSELAIAWCRARDCFDPSLGVPFNAYLMRGMKMHVNAYISREASKLRAVSLDRTVGDDDDLDMHDIIPDQSRPIEEIVGDNQFFQFFVKRLSPRARQYLTLLASPPDELLDINRAIIARTQYANSRGFARFCFHHINSGMIFDFMDVRAAERKRIMDEINRRMERLKDRGVYQ